MDEIPLLRQLLICEKLIVEKDTDYVSLINCYTKRYSDRFPTRPIQMAIYGQFINGSGKIPMELTITRLDTFEEFFSKSFEMEFEDRMESANLMGRFVNGVRFPVETSYQIDLFTRGELLGMSTLHLLKE